MNDEGAILVVVAHPDDEVLGCGGTIARWAAAGRDVHVLILADGEGARPGACGESIKMRQVAAEEANAILGSRSVTLHSLPDNRMDSMELLDVVRLVEESILQHRPKVVLTHHAGDVNVDHRITHEAVLTACRPQPGHTTQTLLYFEVPSSTEWRPAASGLSFLPNWFVDISAALERKLLALQAYKAELRDYPHPRSLKGIEALAHWRGATVGVPCAEAFMLGRRIT